MGEWGDRNKDEEIVLSSQFQSQLLVNDHLYLSGYSSICPVKAQLSKANSSLDLEFGDLQMQGAESR